MPQLSWVIIDDDVIDLGVTPGSVSLSELGNQVVSSREVADCGTRFCYLWVCYPRFREALEYGEDGFSLNHPGGMVVDRDGYNRDGYSQHGYNREGYNRDGYNSEGYDSEGYDYDGYNEHGLNRYGESRPDEDEDDSHDYSRYCDCYLCTEERDSDGVLHSYSYRPPLRFRGGETGPHFGLEIEVTTDHVSQSVDIVDAACDAIGESGLVYCKCDSSVDGIEMVTHPMTYQWAMEHFPWGMLPKLRQDAGCTIVPQENGIHIHVSRKGFKDAAHLYRWMKLWYRNPNDIQRIARRRENHWASFNPEARKGQKDHAMKHGKTIDPYDRDDATMRSRYAVLNTTNPDTIEVRIFASTLRPSRLKAALQLVAASVEYTRNLSAESITKRHGWEWSAFMAWVRKSGQYAELLQQDRVRS